MTATPFDRRLARSRFRRGFYRPHLELLEGRCLPSGNQALTTDPGVQQMPSVAVDPADANHVVIAYMDYSLVKTGYAGIGVAVSHDGGNSWQHSAIPLPKEFDQGAANPIVQFDAQGHVFVSFMSVTFKGPTASALTNGEFEDRGAPGTASNNGIFEVRSDDGGLSWQQPVAIVSHLYDGTHPVFFEVIPDLAVDRFRTLPHGQPNPNFGNEYVCWTRVYPAGQFPGDPNSIGGTDIMVAVSKDSGQTWQTQLEKVPGLSAPVTVIQDPLDSAANAGGSANPLGFGFVDQSQVSVGPEGDLYISYFSNGDYTVAHSTDGGASFVIPDHKTPTPIPFGNGEATNVNESGIGKSNQFRTFPVRDIVADPTRPGYVYVASTKVISDAKGNQIDAADIIFARSTDYGAHWKSTFDIGSTPASVLNDDNGGQSATGQTTDVISGQAMPSLAVDPTTGNLSVIWYDTRRDPAGHLLDVFGTISTNGGQTFSPNYRVTDQSFDANKGVFKDPTTQPGGPEVVAVDFSTGQVADASGQGNYYLGDHLGLALANNTAYAAWTDTRAGNQDIYYSSYTLVPAPAPPNNRFGSNNTASSATDLDQVVQRLVPKLALLAEDEDWFRVQAAATGHLTVSANSIGNQALAPNTLQLQLYDATGTHLLAAGSDLLNATGGLLGQSLVYPSNTGQSFLVRVFRTNPINTSPTFYELNLQSLTADLGTQVVADVRGTLTAGGQALYRLTAPAPGSLQVQFTNGANVQGNLTVQVVDPETLAVLNSPPRLVLAAEPDDSIGEATPTGLIGPGAVQVNGVIGDGPFATTTGDYGFYSLKADAGQRIAVALGDPPGSRLDGVIVLYDSAGHLLQLVDNTGPGGPEFLSYGTAKADTYYVVIYGSTSTDAPPTDPFTPGTGGGVPSHPGAYNLTITVQAVGPGAVQQASVPIQPGQTVLLLVSGEGTSAGDFHLQITNLDQFATPDSTSLLFPAGAGPSSETVGDLNGDGYPDMVVANALSNTVSVLLNNGDGTFQAPRQYAVGSFKVPNPSGGVDTLNDFRRQVVLADLTHNGILDIVVTNFDSGDVSVLLGNGDGTFQPQRRFDATSAPFGAAVGDVNGDGIPDIVAIDSQVSGDSTIAVLLGGGDGTFRPELTFPAGKVGSYPLSTVALADLTGNGKLDLIISGGNAFSAEVFLGNGDGTFQLPGVSYPAGRLSAGLAVADITGDGIPDIITTAIDPSGAAFLTGKGNGTFTANLNNTTGLPLFPAGGSPTAVAVADVGSQVTLPDGTTVPGPPDGHPDLILADSGVTIPGQVSPGPPGIFVVPTLWDAKGRFAE
jgi:hypothetical protein